MRGLLDTLTGTHPLMLPAIEYLDWKRQPTPNQERRFIDSLRLKYGNTDLHVVVTLDDKAFELALENRALFGNAAIVFGGVNHFDPQHYNAALTNVTGVAESKDFRRTLDLIRRLQPNVRWVVGYHDQTESALANRAALEEEIKHFAPHLQCRFIENWSVTELIEQLEQLPPDCAAFSLGATRDRNGVLLADDLDFLKIIADKSAVPVYMISEPIVPLFSDAGWDEAVWCGVGGSLVSGELHGQHVGNLALRVLDGERADDIPPMTNSAGRLAVDWRQMKRFKLPFEALPEGTEVYNRPSNQYQIDKSSIWIAACVILGLSGTVLMLVLNIAHRHRAERQNERLIAAIEQAAEAIVLLDTHGQVSYVSPAFSRITGWSAEEARSSSLNCLAIDPHNTFLAQMVNVIKHGNIYSEQLECRRKNGERLQLIFSGSAVHDPQGRLTAYTLIGRDITREADLENQVRSAQKMEAVGLLAGGVAHDFNNLLQVIIGYTELAMEPGEAEASRIANMKLVWDAAKRGANLPRQLLALGRRQALNIQETNLNEFVASQIDLLSKLIGEQIEVVFAPSAESCHALVDKNQLEQIVLNLCVNARDAMSSTGTLTFCVKEVKLNSDFCDTHAWAREGRYVHLSVKDTGCGMDRETLDHIFEPFFTTKPIHKGSGLGMSVVYGIVQQHNGLLHLDSTPGQGTTIHLYFPQGKSTRKAPAPEPISVQSANAQGTILVVEDDEAVRTIATKILSHAGYKVLEAENGRVAVNCFSKQPDAFDLVLMDMVMPKMSGSEAGEEILNIRPDIPILYSSGYSSDWAAPKQSVLNHHIIMKPYASKSLIAKVSSMLS